MNQWHLTAQPEMSNAPSPFIELKEQMWGYVHIKYSNMLLNTENVYFYETFVALKFFFEIIENDIIFFEKANIFLLKNIYWNKLNR